MKPFALGHHTYRVTLQANWIFNTQGIDQLNEYAAKASDSC
jgi:hypothetical protein